MIDDWEILELHMDSGVASAKGAHVIIKAGYKIKKGYAEVSVNKKRTGSLLLSHLGTIFAVMMLNFCVRYGNRCVHHAIATRSSFLSNSFRESLRTR